ncbi:hypothetical protein ABZ845_25260 [Streptomyces sp. NPDC047022]|uniref:hypothetical protein n=1 Tax=Streptomyces sp. NPDC047022 TaxID=3155737 RepID=UPI0034002034
MGERLSGDGVPVRHRQVHPNGTLPGPSGVHDSAALTTVLATALRTDRLDPEAEQRALAAFRAAAHSAGARQARTRRRDDWRPPEGRRVRHPGRMAFGVVFASLTLSGVAVAAIGSVGSPKGGGGTGRETAHPSAVAPGRPGGAASSTSSSTSSGDPGRTGRPSPAQDTEAHCRAYEQAEKHSKALNATAWQQLVAAAGGNDKVAAYCSEQLRRATASPSKPAGTGKPSKRAADPGNDTAGNTGTHGNSTSGANPGSTHNATGNNQGGSGKHE